MNFFGFLFTPVEVSSPLQKYNGGLLAAQRGWRRSLCGEGESCGASRSWGCWTSSQPSRQLRLELRVKRLNQTVKSKYLGRFYKVNSKVRKSPGGWGQSRWWGRCTRRTWWAWSAKPRGREMPLSRLWNLKLMPLLAPSGALIAIPTY